MNEKNTNTPSQSVTENIVYVLFRRKVLIISCFLVAFVSMLFFVWLITPGFQATNRVLVHNNYKQQLGLINDLSSPGVINPRVNWAINILELARSTELAEAVVEKFDFEERYRRKVEEPESYRESIKAAVAKAIEWPSVKLDELGWVQKKPKDYFAEAREEFMEDVLDVELIEDSEILEISVFEASPKLSGEVVDVLTELLIKKALELDRSKAREALKYATIQLESAEEQFEASRDRLESIKMDWRVTSFNEEKSLLLDNLHNLRKEYDGVLTNMAGKRAERLTIESQLSGGRIGPEDFQKLTEKLRILDQDIGALEGQKNQLEKNIKRQESDIARLISRENEYLRIEKQSNLDEDLYTTLLTKKNELMIQAATEVGEFSLRVVDKFKPSPYADQDWPDLKLVVPIILIFAVGVALVIPFVIEYALDYPRNPRELSETAGAPVLGVIPRHSLIRRAFLK